MTAPVSIHAMHAAAPRCGAKTRRGTPCRAPAMANGRCRMHGGKLRGGPPGNRYAWKQWPLFRFSKGSHSVSRAVPRRS